MFAGLRAPANQTRDNQRACTQSESVAGVSWCNAAGLSWAVSGMGRLRRSRYPSVGNFESPLRSIPWSLNTDHDVRGSRVPPQPRVNERDFVPCRIQGARGVLTPMIRAFDIKEPTK